MIRLDSVDSTNNYAMRLIEADKAVYGMTILASEQTAGKGQRGKTWIGVSGESLLMSLIVHPLYVIAEQPLFLASVAVAVTNFVRRLLPTNEVYIKWPNDILIGDKKAGGILIENLIRGRVWEWAVVGIGMNVRKISSQVPLPYATSLQEAGSPDLKMEAIALGLQQEILQTLEIRLSTEDVLKGYNALLHRRDEPQTFRNNAGMWEADIVEMNELGQLLVRVKNGKIEQYNHGTVEWVWNE